MEIKTPRGFPDRAGITWTAESAGFTFRTIGRRSRRCIMHDAHHAGAPQSIPALFRQGRSLRWSAPFDSRPFALLPPRRRSTLIPRNPGPTRRGYCVNGPSGHGGLDRWFCFFRCSDRERTNRMEPKWKGGASSPDAFPMFHVSPRIAAPQY